MKCKTLVLGAALLALSAGVAAAGTNRIGLNVGAALPTGDYGDVAGTGWHLGATGTHMINHQFGIGGDLNYHSWGMSEDLEDALPPDEEISWSAFQATVHGTLHFPTQSNLKPYAKFGMGIYNLGFNWESPSGDLDDSEAKLGFNFGGGMNFLTPGNMQWGMAAAYHIVPAEDDFGSDVNFFTLGVNMMWGMGR